MEDLLGPFIVVFWVRALALLLKRLLEKETLIPQSVYQSFLNEVKVWFHLRHPHIILMLGACHASRPPFIVCEEANGNLADYLSHPGHVSRTWELLFQAALGLEHLHKCNIVHEILSATTFWSERMAWPKLADFGFSYVRTYSMSERSKDEKQRQSGAFRWRAPECFAGCLRLLNRMSIRLQCAFWKLSRTQCLGEPFWMRTTFDLMSWQKICRSDPTIVRY